MRTGTALSGSRVLSLVINDPEDLDYETDTSIELTIEASDGSLSANAQVTVNLTDDREEDFDGDGLTETQEEDIHGTSDLLADTDGDGYNDGQEILLGTNPKEPAAFPNEAPIISNQSFELKEGGESGSIVRTLIATDRNEDVLSFTITTQMDFDGDGQPAFRTEENKIIINDPDDIDYENSPEWEFNIIVSDGSLTDEALIKLTLTDDRDEDYDSDGLTEAQEEDVHGTSDLTADTDSDGYADGIEISLGTDPLDSVLFPNEAPIMSAQSFEIKELSEEGFEIGSIIATDRNLDSLNYSVVSDGAGAFQVDGNKLQVKDPSAFDYEGTNPMTVVLRVTDG